MSVVFVQAMSFAAAVLIVLSADWAFRGRSKEDDSIKKGELPLFFVWFAGPITALGAMTFAYVEAVRTYRPTRIRQELTAAALSGTLDCRQIVGAQALGALLGIALAAVGMALTTAPGPLVLLVVAFAGFIGWVYPGVWLAKRAEARKLEIAKQLPYALDLLTTAVEAGQDFNAAIRYLTRHGLSGALSEELVTALSEIDIGQSRQQALRGMVRRVPIDELAQLVSAVIQSMEMGSSLADTLRMLSEDLRRMRFHRAERQAARAPSMMIIPMVLFIVPGIFIIVFTPVILRVMGSLGEM